MGVHFVNRARRGGPPLTLRTVWVPNVNTDPLNCAVLTLCTPNTVQFCPTRAAPEEIGDLCTPTSPTQPPLTFVSAADRERSTRRAAPSPPGRAPGG